jgi:hypothetical protein
MKIIKRLQCLFSSHYAETASARQCPNSSGWASLRRQLDLRRCLSHPTSDVSALLLLPDFLTCTLPPAGNRLIRLLRVQMGAMLVLQDWCYVCYAKLAQAPRTIMILATVAWTARWSEPRVCYFHHPACSSPFRSRVVPVAHLAVAVCFLRMTRLSWVISGWSYGLRCLRTLYKSRKEKHVTNGLE